MDLNTLDRGSLAQALCEIGKPWEGNRELDCQVWFALGKDWVHPRWTGDTKSWRDHIQYFGFKKAWLSDHVFDMGLPPISTDLGLVYRTMHEYLPQHDSITLARDPSGVGAEIGNWCLSHPKGPQILEYAKAGHATEELALLTVMFTVIIQKIDGLCISKADFDREWRKKQKERRKKMEEQKLFA